MRSHRVLGGIGSVLVLLGILASPIGHVLLGGDAVVMERPVPRLIAWGICGLLSGLGAYLVLARRRIAPSSLALTAVSTALALLLCELMLFTVGYQSQRQRHVTVPPLAFLRVHHPDLGDRYISGAPPYNWPLNADGLVDLDDFRIPPPQRDARRILLVGDSYTQGIGASQYRESWPERLETGLNLHTETVVWNSGVAGTGPPQYLASLHEYLPVLQPDLVLLAFCQNDVLESLFPKGFMYVFDDSKWIYGYGVNASNTVYAMSPALAYRRARVVPESLPEYLALSRLGHLAYMGIAETRAAVLRRVYGPGRLPRDRANPAGLAAARDILREMAALSAAHGAHLAALVIPYKSDLANPSGRYADTRAMFLDLGIDTIDVMDLFTPGDFDPTGHWNADGQSKFAGLMQCELEARFAALGR